MKINVKNQKKIEAAIEEAEGRASARTIDYATVTWWVEKIEKHIAAFIPKTHRVGVIAHIDNHAQHFPASYKFGPESTQFGLVRGASGWFMTWIARMYCKSPSSRCVLMFSDIHTSKILESMSRLH